MLRRSTPETLQWGGSEDSAEDHVGASNWEVHPGVLGVARRTRTRCSRATMAVVVVSVPRTVLVFNDGEAHFGCRSILYLDQVNSTDLHQEGILVTSTARALTVPILSCEPSPHRRASKGILPTTSSRRPLLFWEWNTRLPLWD